MKKIYYFLAFVLAVAAFSACKPLSKTYDELGDIPKPVAPVVTPPTIASVTLTTADYASLPASNPAALQQFFHGTTDAFASIPAILTKKYPIAGDKSQINVTYATSPFVPALKLADSLNANVAYTLQTTPTDDYHFPAYNGGAANTFDDLSATAVLNYLKYKYQTPLPDNSIRVLTYLYFESGATASSGNLTTDAFLYTTANGWQKIYRVNNAQYASVNRGTNNWFLASDVASNATLPSYFNTFLKSDATVMLTAKAGDIIYVNYRYLTTYQRVMPMAYDGTNWVASSTTATNLFTLSGGVWTGQLDNTVSYTLTAANFATIGGMTGVANQVSLDNLKLHNTFSLDAGSAGVASPTDDGVRWTDAQIANAIKAILKAQYTSPSVNQKFVVTYAVFGGYTTETSLFIYDGTDFVYQPVQDQAKYTLTGDDFTAIARAGIGSAAASLNLNQFGDFASSWTGDQISAGINSRLKVRYTAPTANQVIAVTYSVYNGGNVVTTKNYKFDGTNWVAQ